MSKSIVTVEFPAFFLFFSISKILPFFCSGFDAIFWFRLALGIQAITLCPDVAVYWTNRALCYLKRELVSSLVASCFFLFFFPLFFVSIGFVYIDYALFAFEFRSNWSRVEEDCKKALQLDSHSVKVKQ